MNSSSKSGRDDSGRRSRSIVLAVTGAAVLVLAVIVGVAVSRSDSGDPTETTVADGVALPQNPSLSLTQDEGRWYVSNDGNVTMSDVELREGDAVVCELGTLSPGDRSTCDDASGLGDPSAFGRGPQGQQVRVGG